MPHARRLGLIVATITLIAAVGMFSDAPGGGATVSTAVAQSRLENLLKRLKGSRLPEGIAKANGRIEAQQIDVAAKYPGRLLDVNVEEGDTVEAGAVIARIDATEYEAQLRGAEAQVARAEQAQAEAEALVAQRESDMNLTKAELQRGEELFKNGHYTAQLLDQRRSQMRIAEAGHRAAIAGQRQATLAIEAAKADVARLKAILSDMILVAPRRARVQYKLARSGEVVGAGQRVATLLDLADVYMTIFLPARAAGRVMVGDEARIVLDPAPEYVVPAKVSFVAADAQFTPKAVETAEEREKLMFRVKLQIDSGLLKQYERQVKTGVRGLGFVRTRSDATWPTDLAVKLP